MNALIHFFNNTFSTLLFWIVLLACLVDGAPLLFAQGISEFGELTEFQKGFITYEKDTTATAVYLQEYGDHYFEVRDNYIWLISKYHAKIKILDKRGFDKANVKIPIYRTNEKTDKIVALRAITHNGIVKSGVKSESIFEIKQNEHWSEKRFTFPNVKVGSILEYAYEMQSPFYFNFTGWDFQSDIPKISSEFNARIPGNWVYNRTLVGYLKLKVNEAKITKGCFEFPGARNVGECEDLKYVMQDIPAFQESENYMLSSRNYRSKLVFELSEYNSFYGGKEKYTKSWDDVDKEFRSNREIGSQLRKKNFFAKNLNQDLLNVGDDLARAKAIFDFVQKEFVWNEEYGIWHDNRVKAAYDKKIGNVAELNIILINLLNVAGIRADMMLTATRNRGLPKKNHPVMNDFNYLVAKVDINGKTYLLDATDKNMPFGMLPFRCLNYYGRVMDFEKDSYWFDIVPETLNGKIIRAQMTIDTLNKKLTGVFDLVNTGYLSISQKAKLESIKEDYIEHLEEEISDDFHIKSHAKIDKFSNEKSLTERFEFEIDNFIRDNIIYLNPFIIKFFDKNPFIAVERNFPVDFGYPMKYQYLFNLKVPDGYKLKSMPEDKSYAMPDKGGHLKLNTKQNLNGVLNLLFTFELNASFYPSEMYESIKTMFSEAVHSQNQSLIVLEKE